MRVFLCWHGARSKAVAEELQAWLPKVVQAVEPWISRDIDKGSRWSQEVATELEASKVGIACLTRDNLDSTWIHFEAGALSKTRDARVCTFLLDIGSADVPQPLAQFQHTSAQQEDVHRLVETINDALPRAEEKPLARELLDEAFATRWPQLEQRLRAIAALPTEKEAAPRTDRDILEEILEILRNQERRADQERKARTLRAVLERDVLENITVKEAVTGMLKGIGGVATPIISPSSSPSPSPSLEVPEGMRSEST